MSEAASPSLIAAIDSPGSETSINTILVDKKNSFNSQNIIIASAPTFPFTRRVIPHILCPSDKFSSSNVSHESSLPSESDVILHKRKVKELLLSKRVKVEELQSLLIQMEQDSSPLRS